MRYVVSAILLAVLLAAFMYRGQTGPAIEHSQSDVSPKLQSIAQSSPTSSILTARSEKPPSKQSPQRSNSEYEMAVEEALKRTGTDVTLQARKLVQEWAREDWNSAAQWIEQYPRGREQIALAVGVVEAQVDTRPQEVANWAAGFQSLSSSVGLLHTIYQRWAQQDSEKALEWVVNELAYTDHTQRLIRAVFESLASNEDNWTQLSRYLDTMKPGLKRDWGIAAFVSKIKPHDEEMANLWYGSIGSRNTINRNE